MKILLTGFLPPFLPILYQRLFFFRLFDTSVARNEPFSVGPEENSGVWFRLEVCCPDICSHPSLAGCLPFSVNSLFIPANTLETAAFGAHGEPHCVL